MSTPGWPAQIHDGDVTLRPLRTRDAGALMTVREANVDWLRPWETTAPGARFVTGGLGLYAGYVADLRRLGRRGQAMSWGIFHRGRLCGQLVVGTIIRGAQNSGQAGYWVAREAAGQGIAPTALALAVDHCLGPAQLHRVEVNIRPDNQASLRVAEKLGLRPEGLRPRYLHIDGTYRDHLAFAVDTEDLAGGSLVARWQARDGAAR